MNDEIRAQIEAEADKLFADSIIINNMAKELMIKGAELGYKLADSNPEVMSRSLHEQRMKNLETKLLEEMRRLEEALKKESCNCNFDRQQIYQPLVCLEKNCKSHILNTITAHEEFKKGMGL